MVSVSSLSRLQKNIINIVVFNAVWLVCVLGGDTLALTAVFVTVLLHMKVISDDFRELYFISAVGVIGLIVEFGFVYFGVLQSPSSSLLPPLWLLSLWPLFATTLNHSTRWFQGRPGVSVLAGGIAGPVTYYTGTRLTSYEVVAPFNLSLIKLAIVWMIVFPLVMWLAKKFNLPAD